MSKKITRNVIEEYLRVSYFSVDGLWFVLTEKKDSEEKALQLDSEVWSALPRIQVRNAVSMLEIKEFGLKEFSKVLEVKLVAEKYEYVYQNPRTRELLVKVKKCPWYDILKRSNRVYLAPQIAGLICGREFEAWGKEFNKEISFTALNHICLKGKECVFSFVL